jgi:hypothetical protein
MKSTLHRLRVLAAIAGALLLAGCASLIGPRQVDVPLARLQQGIDRHFPRSQRMLEIFDIQLSRPLLALEPNTGRVLLSLDAAISPPFSRLSWNGSLTVSGRLAIDSVHNTINYSEVRVEKFVFNGGDESRQRQLAKVANVLLDQVVKDVPLTQFRPDDLRYAGVQFVPTNISMRGDALVVTLEPAR